MKFSAVQLEPVAIRPDDAAKMFGVSADKFQTLVEFGWLAPSVRERNITLYDVEDIRRVWKRIKQHGFPTGTGVTTQSDRVPAAA